MRGFCEFTFGSPRDGSLSYKAESAPEYNGLLAGRGRVPERPGGGLFAYREGAVKTIWGRIRDGPAFEPETGSVDAMSPRCLSNPPQLAVSPGSGGRGCGEKRYLNHEVIWGSMDPKAFGSTKPRQYGSSHRIAGREAPPDLPETGMIELIPTPARSLSARGAGWR